LNAQEDIYLTFEVPESTYFVTFRLSGTLPQNVLHEIQLETNTKLQIAKKQNRRLTPQEEQRLKYLKSKKIQEYLDNGIGECWLQKAEIAQMVMNAIRYFDGTTYVSHAFCIMPNHVHWLVTPKERYGASENDSLLVPIMHTLKSFTSNQANKMLNRTGPFWSREYYDHRIRNSEQFRRILVYILENPIKAGLCHDWQQWPWTSSSETIRASLNS
jgi:REP element-mobilizing transposase RayT